MDLLDPNVDFLNLNPLNPNTKTLFLWSILWLKVDLLADLGWCVTLPALPPPATGLPKMVKIIYFWTHPCNKRHNLKVVSLNPCRSSVVSLSKSHYFQTNCCPCLFQLNFCKEQLRSMMEMVHKSAPSYIQKLGLMWLVLHSSLLLIFDKILYFHLYTAEMQKWYKFSSVFIWHNDK